MSHQLTELGVEHAVLEQARVAEAWWGRWDFFTLVTPSWTIRLPGMGSEGRDDPQGFLSRAGPSSC